jgi:hypothetical protein
MASISFGLWALFAPVVAGDAAVEVGVLVHDPATDTLAALRLSDRPHVDAHEIHDERKLMLLRLTGSTRADDSNTRGFVSGDPHAVDRLAALAPRWSDAPASVAAMLTGTSAAVFEGVRCGGCGAVQRPGVAVIGVGIDPPLAEAIAVVVGAVGGDAVERLLALADAADELWPHRPGPVSATLVAIGQARARESIAVDRHGRVGRRLLDAHLRHLADIELPFQLGCAREAWADGDEAALAVHRRRALAAARRAREAFPDEPVLLRHLREAEALRPEHDAPGP